MRSRVRRAARLLCLLLVVAVATRGSVWAHACVSGESHAVPHLAVEMSPASARTSHQREADVHAHGQQHDHGRHHEHTAADATHAPPEEAPVSREECTCIGDCCVVASAALPLRRGLVPVPAELVRSGGVPARSPDALPSPPEFLRPFAIGPPASVSA